MNAGFATVHEEEGILVTSAEVNGFTLSELRFPPNYLQGAFEPELPYLAVVLDGPLAKSFRNRTLQLSATCVLQQPESPRFGPWDVQGNVQVRP